MHVWPFHSLWMISWWSVILFSWVNSCSFTKAPLEHISNMGCRNGWHCGCRLIPFTQVSIVKVTNLWSCLKNRTEYWHHVDQYGNEATVVEHFGQYILKSTKASRTGRSHILYPTFLHTEDTNKLVSFTPALFYFLSNLGNYIRLRESVTHSRSPGKIPRQNRNLSLGQWSDGSCWNPSAVTWHGTHQKGALGSEHMLCPLSAPRPKVAILMRFGRGSTPGPIAPAIQMAGAAVSDLSGRKDQR